MDSYWVMWSAHLNVLCEWEPLVPYQLWSAWGFAGKGACTWSPFFLAPRLLLLFFLPLLESPEAFAEHPGTVQITPFRSLSDHWQGLEVGMVGSLGDSSPEVRQADLLPLPGI